MIIACDVDGVLADFNKGFATLFPKQTLPTSSPTFPPVWEWPQHYGASEDEIRKAWMHVETSKQFWLDLAPMTPAQEKPSMVGEALRCLSRAEQSGHAIYFVTQRVGKNCKKQTEQWLHKQGMANPTVLVVQGSKAPIISELQADIFADDKPLNIEQVSGETRCYLVRTPYNVEATFKRAGIKRANSILEVLKREGLYAYRPPTKDGNPKDGIGATKMPLHLWPEVASALGCLGLLDGALKYGRNNWRDAGVRASIYVDAIRRHLSKWWEGEDIDPDSGLPHEAHMLASLAILVDAKAAGLLHDDRNKKGEGFITAIEELTPHVARLQQRKKTS